MSGSLTTLGTRPSTASIPSIVSRTAYRLALMVGIAFAIRMVVVLCVFRSLADPSGFHERFGWEVGWVARSLALGYGFSSPFFPPTGPTALVPPVYPFLLASVFRVFGLYTAASGFVILTLNSLFSALTCIPICAAAQHALGRRTAQLAGWLWVVYPFSIYFSAAMVWDFALTALLFAICFAAAQRLPLHRRLPFWIAFGLLYGLTVLSNPSVLCMLPVLLGIAFLRMRKRPGPHGRLVFAALLAFAATLTPWIVRNVRVLHVLTPVRDNFWLELWAGNTGDTSASNPAWSHPASNPDQMHLFRSLGEVAYLAQKRDLARRLVIAHPGAFAATSFRRALAFWTGFWSLSPGYLRQQPLDIPNIFFCSGVTFFMFRGLRRSSRLLPGGALPFLILVLIFPFTYYLTHASMDYRQPIEPEIIILVTVGIFGLRPTSASGTIRQRKRLPSPQEADLEPALT